MSTENLIRQLARDAGASAAADRRSDARLGRVGGGLARPRDIPDGHAARAGDRSICRFRIRGGAADYHRLIGGGWCTDGKPSRRRANAACALGPFAAATACVLWAAGEARFCFCQRRADGTGHLWMALRLQDGQYCRRAQHRALRDGPTRAPLRAAWAGSLAVLSTTAVGVLGANIICPTIGRFTCWSGMSLR